MNLAKAAMESYHEITKQALSGKRIDRSQAAAILRGPDTELRSLLWAAFEVRRQHFGRKVKLVVIRNARSGRCGEDCHYCSQSAVSSATISKYPLQPLEQLVEAARAAVARGAERYCMVTSGRGPSSTDVVRLAEAAQAIKQEFPALELCVSPGIIDEQLARLLREAGVGWINHNLNTSERFHPRICGTHGYQDRLNTIAAVRRAGLALCSGGIVGMGETDEDVLDLAYALAEIRPESLPVNFLQPIAGTPLADRPLLSPQRALRILCLFRFLSPASDLRAASGREKILGSWQSLSFYPANSIFVDGYLTTKGDPATATKQMIEEHGFEAA